MSNRRPKPGRLLLALLLALLAPLGVMAATGLSGVGGGDGVETAGGGPGGERDDADALANRSDETEAREQATTTSSPASTTTSPSTTAPPTTTPPTTAPATTAPPATEPPPTEPPSAPAPVPGETEMVVALANMARIEAGCAELQLDDRLTAAAQGHSDDMAAQGYFAHESPDGRTFVDRGQAAGYPNPGGENIAQGQRSAMEVHESWMGSEGHRANILNCGFTTIGVGLHEGTWTWTQNFGY